MASPQAQSGTQSASPTLPPIVTDTPVRLSATRRISSSAKDRLSVYSNVSQTSQRRPRPVSHVFPIFHSSLPYTLVRDFAYAATHPLHYGPLPASSTASTPVSEHQRLSDPQPVFWDTSRSSWSGTNWSSDPNGNQQLPAMSFGDGPPYSEDEDLHSPIITSRYRKIKSVHFFNEKGRGRSPGDSDRHSSNDNDRGMLVSLNGDGSETYYVRDEDTTDDGPGGEYVTYPASERRYSEYPPGHTTAADVGKPPMSSQGNEGFDYDDTISDLDPSRYSRDYQFSIGSPDEEMHGKAVALFDFTREHENELPLQEGQVILVSYRHGQGWLVAEDPKTGESGLVPEEFVRLVRDIEGGLTSLNGEINNNVVEANSTLNVTPTVPDQAATPTQNDHFVLSPNSLSTASENGNNHEKHPSMNSTFSTTSGDLNFYPSRPLGDDQGTASPAQAEEDKMKIEHDGHVETASAAT